MGLKYSKRVFVVGWGGGALQTDDMVTKRGEGAPKMFRKKRKLVQMGPQSNLTQSCFPADKTLLFLYLTW